MTIKQPRPDDVLSAVSARISEVRRILASGRAQAADDKLADLLRILPPPRQLHVEAAKVWGEAK